MWEFLEYSWNAFLDARIPGIFLKCVRNPLEILRIFLKSPEVFRDSSNILEMDLRVSPFLTIPKNSWNPYESFQEYSSNFLWMFAHSRNIPEMRNADSHSSNIPKIPPQEIPEIFLKSRFWKIPRIFLKSPAETFLKLLRNARNP